MLIRRLNATVKATRDVRYALARTPPDIETRLRVVTELGPLPNFEHNPSITIFPFIREDFGMPMNASSLQGSKMVYFIALQTQNKTEPRITEIFNHSA